MRSPLDDRTESQVPAGGDIGRSSCINSPAATNLAMPGVNAPTTEWFVYYRKLVERQSTELERLRRIENAAMRVASSRRNRVVTDQGPLDALDEALEAQS